MKSIFKTLIEFAFGLHLNLDLKTKNRKGILLEKLLFFPFWPNLGTSPAASLPSLARSACSAGPARGPSSLPLSRSPLAPAQLAARSAQRCCPARLRPHSLAPARFARASAWPIPRWPLRFGLHLSLHSWPARQPSAKAARVASLSLTALPAPPVSCPHAPVVFPFFPVSSFLSRAPPTSSSAPPMAQPYMVSHHHRHQACREGHQSAPLPFLLRRSTPGL